MGNLLNIFVFESRPHNKLHCFRFSELTLQTASDLLDAHDSVFLEGVTAFSQNSFLFYEDLSEESL